MNSRILKSSAIAGMLAMSGARKAFIFPILMLPAIPAAAGWADRPNFQLPFHCGQVWKLVTRVGHDPDDKKLDMLRLGRATAGSGVVASAPGRVHQWFEPGGLEIDHGNGWFTVYLHMNNRVGVGTWVRQGQKVGTAGSVGTKDPHLHYEQLYDSNGDGDGETNEMVHPIIQNTEYRLNPDAPGSFPSVLSRNACGSKDPIGVTKLYVDTSTTAIGYLGTYCLDDPSQYCRPQGELYAATNYVFCKRRGDEVRNGSNYNRWWTMTDLDKVYPGKSGRAYVSAYYLSRWGNNEARDNYGNNLPVCY